MANDITRRLGAGPGQYPSPQDVIGARYPPLEAIKSQFENFLGEQLISAADHALGNSVGAIGWSKGSCRRSGGVSSLEIGRSRPYHLATRAFGPTVEPSCFGGCAPRAKIATWLILPVVICLSQRLSHACLSISNHTVKLRMAH